jgi:class 3 adenylate cyclase
MRFLFIFLSCFLLINLSRGQTIQWDESNDIIELGDKLKILEDEKGIFTFKEVSSDAYNQKFIPSDKKNLNFEFSLSIFWLKFSVDNKTKQNAIIELDQAGVAITELYYFSDSGQVVHLKAGYKVPISEKTIKSAQQAFPIPQGKRDYYIKISNNSQPIPINLYKESVYESKSTTKKMTYGFYLGLMFFVILSNLFFFVSLHNRMYLFYSCIVLLYASYGAFVVDGFIGYIIPNLDLFFWFTTIPTIGVTIQTIYCLYFLEVRKYNLKLFKVVRGIVIYFGIWAITKFFFTLPIVQPINILNALTSFFLMGFIGFKVGKRGNKMGYYFASAYIIYFLLVLTEATYVATGSPKYLGGLSHTAYATVIEAFILSFLLSKRVEWEKEDLERSKLEAQKLLLEKTLENEKIVKEQNVILEQRVEERTHLLQQEKQKSDDLLHNILPDEIAAELKEHGISEAKLYEKVTVIFTDFVNFTGISESVAPKELVYEIDLCYKAFDEIMERNNIEKIKTIGDAYLAVSGLPTADDLHAKNMVKAALEIKDFIEKRKNTGGLFSVRIGVNSGTVVAGIVGIKKFAYDIWGDTVNTAHRMESNSETGRINISGSTYELVKDYFDCEYRGKIEAKNKGSIDMYFVNGLKSMS